ncbi:hypothetical protein [Aquabacterium sp.]
MSNPTKPTNVYHGGSSLFLNHGMSFNADGTHMYLRQHVPCGHRHP